MGKRQNPASGALALQALRDLAQQHGAAVNVAGINLEQLRARLEFFPGARRVGNSTGSDDR